jgi:5,10-methylenetetrahydrofolate reductase
MLRDAGGFSVIAEVNPPELPNDDHRRLDSVWERVIVTDNPFGTIRVSPFAYAARITHDVPSVAPTVVVSTRDRNIRAIESEVRGALGNGVRSFLVVVGDTVPEVDHLAHHHEIVVHLSELRDQVGMDFEIGMPTRMRRWQFQQRIDKGADFFVIGPFLDHATIAENIEKLGLSDDDPPVCAMVIPPVSLNWVQRAEGFGAVRATDALKATLTARPGRGWAWDQATLMIDELAGVGCRAAVITGMRFETLVGEAAEWLGGLTPIKASAADPSSAAVDAAAGDTPG